MRDVFLMKDIWFLSMGRMRNQQIILKIREKARDIMKRRLFDCCYVELQVDKYHHLIGDRAVYRQKEGRQWIVTFTDDQDDVEVSPDDFIVLSVHPSRVHKGNKFILLLPKEGLHIGSLVVCTKVYKHGASIIDGDEKECFVPFWYLGYLHTSEEST